jgi:hypothetical protein
MEFNEIIEQLEQFKETDDYKNYVGGLSQVTPDRVKEFLSTEDGKKTLQPEMDKYFNKGLETWKANNLEKIVTEELQKRNPSADPKDVELQTVKAQLEEMKAEAIRKDMTNVALKIATEKNLPVDLIDYFVGMDEATTKKNLAILESAFNAKVSASVDEKIKSNTHIPTADKTEPLTGVEQAFKNLTGIQL